MSKSIMVFDTSIATNNLGDFIIMDAVNKQIRNIFKDDLISRAVTHDVIGGGTTKISEHADLKFLGGTNLLSGYYIGRNHSQWRVGFSDLKAIGGIIGIGLGWSSYEINRNGNLYKPLKLLQRKFYNKIFFNNFKTSVRDSYTESKMLDFGIETINTSCVTMWELNQDAIDKIPKRKGGSVVTTITNYCNTPEYVEMYQRMFVELLKTYDEVSLWIQSVDDYKLFDKLFFDGKSRIHIIPPSLEIYDTLLKNGPVDYVGTRLHAGIRALQHGRRALIIEVDNRAKEIARDTHLPTISWRDIQSLSVVIDGNFDIKLTIPIDKIRAWKEQFM